MEVVEMCLLEILRVSDRPVLSRELMAKTGLSDVEVRQLISSMVKNKRAMIFGGANGFELIRSKKQFDHAVASLGSRESEIRERRLALQEAWAEQEAKKIGEQMALTMGA